MSKRNPQTEALFEIWVILSRFRWRFIAPAFIVAVLVLAASLMLPRKYKAEAVFERRTDMVLSEIVNHGVGQYQDPRQSRNNKIVGEPALDQLLTSLKTNGNLLEQAKLLPHQLISDVKRKTSVTYDIASVELDRIRVSYVGMHPEISRTVVNELVRSYIERTRKHLNKRLSQSAAFFEEETEKSKAAIAKLESKQLTYEIEHADLLPNNPNSVQAILTITQQTLREAEQRLATAQSDVEGLTESFKATPKTVPSTVMGRNPQYDRLQTQLRIHQTKHAELTGVFKMKAKHPDIVALLNQINDVQKQLATTNKEIVKETRENANHKYSELELLLTRGKSELASATAQVAQIKERVQALDKQADNLFVVRSEYRKITRKIEDMQSQMGFWDDNLSRVEMALAAETGDRGIQLEFIKECGVLHKPVSPNLTQVLLATGLLGIIAGVISVFYAYRTDESFSDSDTLSETFSLPTFGAVSEIISKRQQSMRKLRRAVIYPFNALAMTAALVILTGLLYMSLERPKMMDSLKENPKSFFQEWISKVFKEDSDKSEQNTKSNKTDDDQVRNDNVDTTASAEGTRRYNIHLHTEKN
jgi:uncharacterized protein involved in exopolysaccharide biosynthesis